MIMEGTLVYSDQSMNDRIDELKNLILNNFDNVSLISDTGSGSTRNVVFKLADSLHYFILQAVSSSSIKFAYYYNIDSSTYDSTPSISHTSNIDYKITKFGNTEALFINNLCLFIITKVRDFYKVLFRKYAGSSTRYFQLYGKENNNSISVVPSSPWGITVEKNKEAIIPIFVYDDFNNALFETPMENLFSVDLSEYLEGQKLIVNGNKYIAVSRVGNSSIHMMVRYG